MEYELREIWTVDDLMEHLAIGKNTVYDLLKSKQIKAFKIGHNWKIPQNSVNEYIIKGTLNFSVPIILLYFIISIKSGIHSSNLTAYQCSFSLPTVCLIQSTVKSTAILTALPISNPLTNAPHKVLEKISPVLWK